MSTVDLSKRAEFSRRVRHPARCLLALLAFVACNGRAGDEPEKTQLRDGAWLRNGIAQSERLNAHENLSDKDTNEALVVRSYVCAIGDLERYLVQRANLLAEALRQARKRHHANPEKLDGMSVALPILVPLMQTRFLTESPPCNTIVLVVRDYLRKYPEMLPKDADVIIDKALLDEYSMINEP